MQLSRRRRAERFTTEVLPPLDFLKTLMRDERLPLPFRVEVAAIALPYSHPGPAPFGSKYQRDADA
jgi:hypothetical protein